MITESKLKTGVLTLGGATPMDWACQATNVRITPSFNSSGDEVETLCGATLQPDTKTAWVIAGTSIQDFDRPEGFVLYCFENNLATVTFSWTPNPTSGTWSGSCQIKAVEVGGDVGARLTTDWEFPITGDPILTPYTP